MISRKNHIKRSEFSEFFKKTKTVHGDLLYIKFFYNTEHLNQKFACITPKKIIRGAVQRHRVRRWVYHIIQKLSKNLPENVVIMVFLKKNTKTLSYQVLYEELYTVLGKAKLIQN